MSGATVRNILALSVFLIAFGGALFVLVVNSLGYTATADMEETFQTWGTFTSGVTGVVLGYYFRRPGGNSSP